MIIGFCGKAGAGKDTAADILVENFGYEKVSFAAILKNMLEVAGVSEPSNRDDKEKQIEGFDFSWREAAQKLGTEWGRSLDNNIWVKLTMANLNRDDHYVFSDVRFDNEALAIRNAGGVVVLLKGRSVDLGANSTHASEQGISDHLVDWVVDNTLCIGRLEKQLEQMLAVIEEENNNA